VTTQLIDALLGSLADAEPSAPALSLAAVTANENEWLDTETWVGMAFAQTVIEGREPFTAEVALKHDFDRAVLLPDAAVVLRSSVDHERPERPWIFARTPTGHIHISPSHATVSAASAKAARKLLQMVVDRIPASVEADEPGKAEVEMWQLSQHSGGSSRSKVIDVPAWADVQRNYAAATAEQLARLIARGRPSDASGKLMVWYGQPGTGKTTAIRTLMREWSSWCTFHYIPDPEVFFNQVSYMAAVLSVDSTSNDDDEPKHRVVILEDCDEFITADARHRSGNALGRLLNLSDGIMGQGSKVIVLLTTNEDIMVLHPALTRPGRCLAKVEFRPFTADQARTWLDDPTIALPSSTPTLAELFESKSATPRIATHDDTDAPGLYL